MPEQPATPALPQQLSGLGAGGYTFPQQQAPQNTPIPNALGPSYQASPQSPYAAPQSFQTPPAPQAVSQAPQGVPQQDMNGILSQLQSAPDPQLFAQRFNMLMDQRTQVAGPEAIDSRGFQVPSKDQEKYIKTWLDQHVQFLTAPEELGGSAMSPFQARVQAVNEAKQQFPNLDPRYLAAWGQAAGPGSPSTSENSTKKTTVTADGQVVNFGPDRAAKITPEKIAEILTRPDFQDYLKLADEYKNTVAGGMPSAKEFAKYVMNQRFGKNQQDAETQRQALEEIQTQGGPVALKALTNISQGKTPITLSKTEQQMVDNIVGSADEKAASRAISYFLKHIPKATDVHKESQDWFAQHAHELSVVAGLQNFY